MRIPLRQRLARWRYRRCPAVVPVLLVALALFFGFWAAVSAYLRPAIKTLAVSSATNRISETVSRTVNDCVTQQGLTYQELITMETDESGKVTSLTSNFPAVSLLQSQLTERLSGALEELRTEQFGVPLGTLTGWVIFSGKGPVIRVELLSTGDVTTQMRHSFEDAGINQTLHRVMLDVSVTVYLLIPGETLSTTVDSSICVAETVIVGQVPETYLYLGNGENKYG